MAHRGNYPIRQFSLSQAVSALPFYPAGHPFAQRGRDISPRLGGDGDRRAQSSYSGGDTGGGREETRAEFLARKKAVSDRFQAIDAIRDANRNRRGSRSASPSAGSSSLPAGQQPLVRGRGGIGAPVIPDDPPTTTSDSAASLATEATSPSPRPAGTSAPAGPVSPISTSRPLSSRITSPAPTPLSSRISAPLSQRITAPLAPTATSALHDAGASPSTPTERKQEEVIPLRLYRHPHDTRRNALSPPLPCPSPVPASSPPRLAPIPPPPAPQEQQHSNPRQLGAGSPLPEQLRPKAGQAGWTHPNDRRTPEALERRAAKKAAHDARRRQREAEQGDKGKQDKEEPTGGTAGEEDITDPDYN